MMDQKQSLLFRGGTCDPPFVGVALHLQPQADCSKMNATVLLMEEILHKYGKYPII